MADLRRTLTDMGRSLGLMALVVAGLLFLGPARALVLPGSDRAAPVDYANAATAFTRLAHSQVVAPTTLPSSWRANADRLTTNGPVGVHLHIGWATPGDGFVGLDEATGDAAALIQSVLGRRGADVTGVRVIASRSWDVRVSQRGEQSLTRDFGVVHVVITGSATDAQLTRLAATLL